MVVPCSETQTLQGREGGNLCESLEADPTPNPFSFTYDPTDSMKKKWRDEESEDEENEAEGPAVTLFTAPNVHIVEVAVQKGLEQLKAFLKEHHSTLVKDVANKVTTILLDKAPHDTGLDNYYHKEGYEGFQVQDLGDEGDGNEEVVPTTQEPVADEVPRPGKYTGLVAVLHAGEDTGLISGPRAGDVALDAEQPSLFSLGLDDDIVQAPIVEAPAGEVAKMPPSQKDLFSEQWIQALCRYLKRKCPKLRRQLPHRQRQPQGHRTNDRYSKYLIRKQKLSIAREVFSNNLFLCLFFSEQFRQRFYFLV